MDNGKKDNLQTQLSLLKIVELNNSLSEEQKIAVESIGFEGLLQLKCTILKHTLCRWLVNNFNLGSSTLEIYGHEVKLTSRCRESIWFAHWRTTCSLQGSEQ